MATSSRSPDLHTVTSQTSRAPLVTSPPGARAGMSSAGRGAVEGGAPSQSGQAQAQQQQQQMAQGGAGKGWHTTLMQFGKPGFPFKNLFCPCVGYITNKGLIEELPPSRVQPYKGEDSQILNGRDFLEMGLHLTTGCCVGFEILQRRSLRERLSIPGSPLQDLLLSCCCLPCSQAQQTRELEFQLEREREKEWQEKGVGEFEREHEQGGAEAQGSGSGVTV